MTKMDDGNLGSELCDSLMAKSQVSTSIVGIIQRVVGIIALMLAVLGASAPASAYCTAEGATSSYEWLDTLNINGSLVTTGNNGGYYLHPEYFLGTPVVNLELTPGFASYAYGEYWGVWVDWNQDDEFSAAEQVFSGQTFAEETLPATFTVPADALTGPTRMRIAMRWGSAPEPCGSFSYGEVEDVPLFVNVTGDQIAEPSWAYELSLGPDYTVYRNGALNADVTWVVEKDGAIVLQSNGTHALSLQYWSMTEGNDFRIWLEEGGMTVSEPVEFTVGQTLNYQLSVDSAHHLIRSGLIGEPLTWVIEQDGVVVLERYASSELDYTYFDNTTGSHFRVWLKQYINGAYERVSNVVEYKVDGSLDYELMLDTSHRVVRTGNLGEPLLWRVEKNGVPQGFVGASTDLQWIDYERSDGATYAVTLVIDDGLQTPVSNTVQYTVDDIPATHTLNFADGALTRSGTLGESLTWVIEEEGRIELKRAASGELQYYPSINPELQYRFWLEAFVDGGYQRVSNIVIPQAESSTLPPTPSLDFELSLGPDYTVYRNGALDANVTWVVEKDGEIVLQANGTYELSMRYFYMTEGSDFRIWLKQPIDGTYVIVSNTVEFTVGETLSYQLLVDSAYNLTRSGLFGDPLTWVIEQDGGVVLERDASTELDYTYYSNIAGAHYRVWLKQSMTGRRVSNVVEYVVGSNVDYDLALDTSHRVVRTGNLGEPLLWRVDKDGMLQAFYDATSNQQWIDYEHSEGSSYAVTLVANDSLQTPVSNTVQYTVDDVPLTHSLSFADGLLSRSGTLGESVTWVIENNGSVVLERSAANELEYAPYMYMPSQQYRFWLEAYVDGGYQRISNIVISQ